MKRTEAPSPLDPDSDRFGDPRAPEAARVLRQFRLVFNIVKTHFQQVEKKVGVGGAQVWALHLVQQSPGLGVHALARAMDVRQPTASNLVRLMASQALVQVRREGSDRRAVQLHLLPAGQDLLQRAPGPFSGVLPQALGKLNAATLARLEHDLDELIDILGASERGAGIPLAPM